MSSTPAAPAAEATSPAAAPAAAAPAAPSVATPAAPTAPAAAAPAPNAIAAALQTAFATCRNRVSVAADLTAARAALAARESDLVSVREALATATASVTAANVRVSEIGAQLGAVLSALGMKPEALTGQDAAAVRTTVTNHISAAASEQVAALGFNVAELPGQAPGNGGGAAETLEELNTQMAECKDGKKLGELAARAVALRNKCWAATGQN
jgi:hypothetical protein